MTPSEVREWVKFIVILIGGAIALRTYIVSQRQRKLENSMKLLDIFFSSLENDDLKEWKTIFMNSSEPSGASAGHFVNSNDNNYHEIPFWSLFSEGPADNGANSRIVQQLDLIAYEALRGTVDVRFIYTRIGQLITTEYMWFGGNMDSVITQHYPHFNKFVRKHKADFKKWPTKVYSYIE